MNEQLLKDFLATAKKDNYNWDVILPKFPELKDYDLQLLKDYAATAKKDNYDYSIINPKFPEFNLEKQEGGEPVNFTEGSVEQQEQPTEPLEKPIVDEVNLNPYAVTTTSLAGRNIEKPKTTYDDSFRGKFKQLLDEEVEKIDDDKIVSQEEQSDILSKLTKRAEQIEVERAGIEVPEDALFEKTSAQKALDELLVKEFPIDVISEGGRNVSPTIENLEKLKKLDPAFSDYVYNKALKQKNFFDKLEKGQVTERDKYKIMADFNSLKLQDSYDNLQITINENNKIVEDIDKSIEQQKNEMLSTPYFVLDEDGKFSAGIIKTPEQRAEAQSMYNKLSSLIDDKNAQSTSPQYSKNYIDFLNASTKQDALESGEYKDIHKKLKENEIYKEELLDGSWASFGKDLTARLVNGASSFVANSVAFTASMASSYRSLIGADYKYGISDMVVDWAESTSEPFNASERKFTMKDPFTGETKYDAGGLVLSGVDQLGLLFGLAFGNKYSSIKAANKLSKAGITGKRASDAMKISQRWNTFLTGTMASHAQNLRESREMGLSGADLFAYTTFMSTLEGTSELVFPNQNILGKDLKDIALKTFVKNLGKGRKLALKTSLNEVLTAMGSEAAEEYIVLLGKMTQTALISINNEEINTYIPEFEEVIETGAVASLVGGGSTSVIQGYQNITGAKRKEIMSYAISKGTEVDFNGLKTAVAQQVEKENISQYDADSYLLNVHLANNYAKYIPDEIKGKTRQELLPIAQQLDSLIKQSKEKEGVAKKALQKRIKVLEDYMESKIKGESITQTPSYDKPTVFTTPTSERYGTVNRQDGKGDVVLTEEEYNNEISLFEQQQIKEITPTEEVSETVETISPLSERLKNVRVARVGGTFDKGARGEAINEKEIEEAQSVLMDELNEIENSNLPQEQKDAASAEVEKLFNELENYELTTETKTRKITQKRPTRVVREGVEEQTKSPQERSVGRKINIVDGTEFTQEGFAPQEGETIVLEEQDGKIVLQAFDKDGNKTKSQELELENVNDLELVETLKDDDGRVIGATVRNKNNDAEVFSIMDEELALDYAIEKTKAEVGEMSIEEESVFEEYEEVKKRPTKKEPTKEVVEDDSDKIFEQKKSEIESRRRAELEANSRFTGEKVIADQINAKYNAELNRLKAQSQSEAAPVEEVAPTTEPVETATTTEGVETTTDLTEEQVSELNKFLGLDKSKRKASRKGITKKDNQRLDKVERAVDLLEQSLSEVMPNIVISVAEDSDMFARFAGEQEEKKEDRSKGLFTRVDGTYVIVLNPDSADVTTVFHEGLHAVLVAGGLPNTMARAVTSRMVEAVKKTATKKLQRELEAFTELYETPLQSEEYIAELIGILANNYNEQNNETKSIIRRWLQKLAEMLGLKPKGVSLSTVGLNNTDAATIDALNFVAKKMSEGGVLTEQDLTRLVQPGEEQQGDGSEETVTRKQKAAIEILDGPKFDKKKKQDVAAFLNGLRDSVIPPDSSKEDLISRFVNNIYEEVGYYLYSKEGPREAGLTWYIEDMKEFGDKIKIILPELKNENQYKLFLSILAITSSGTNPNQNLLYSYNLWNNSKNPSDFNFSKNWGDMKMSFIDKKGKSLGNGVIQKETAREYVIELIDSLGRPVKDRKGNIKTKNVKKNSLKNGYPKSTGYTNRGEIVIGQLEKLEKIYKKLGSLEAVVEWLQTPHSIAELREYNISVPDINGKSAGKTNKVYDPKKNAEGERNGAFIFGEKIGSFYQNMIGIGETITMDLWWSRTWNRYMGTMFATVKGKTVIQETPRTDRERNIMREAVKMVAEDLNLDVSELQAAIWYFEQELWTNSGNASPSYSYVTAIDDLTKKLKVDEKTKSKLQEARADLSAAEKRRQTAAKRAVDVVSRKSSEETVTRKQKRKKPKSKVKDAFEWGMQKGVPAIAVKNHLIKLGYTEEEITSGAYDAEKIWNKDGKKVVKWLDYGRRAALSARKFRPQTMFLAKEAMESSISAELRQAKMMAENLNRAINKYKSQDKRDELIDAVDEFMRDAEERDFWRNELPDDIAQIAEAMRVHIDSLSLKLVDSGVIKAESSRENILANIGVYMNRSYQVFDNKNWKEEVSEQVITAAQNHLRDAYYNSLSGISELDQQLKDGKITESEYNRRKNRILSNKASVKEIMDRDNVSEDEALTMHVDDIIDSILSKKDVNEYILFAQPKVGKKDLSSLKRRKDIPPAIRALMGEYTDPGYNYAMSIFKIANLVENQKYLTKIRDAGLGVWLFEKEAGKKIPEGYEKITFKGDASMNPLDGLYAPKEVKEAFNDIELNRMISGIPKIGRLYGYWLKGVGAVKYNKTILSYGTHAKNVIGNMYFMAQNGYLDPREYQQPFIALVKQFSGKELTAEQEAKMDEWVRAGIIGQGATIGEIKSFFEGEDSFEKALTKRIDKKTDNMLSKVGKGVKKFGEKAQEAYQYEDDMFKIVAYEKEKLNYSKILFDGKSYNQLDASQQSTVNDYVAEIIKNILPNYGRIGDFGKGLKAFPIAGTFISFQIEAYRTAYNTVALAIQEIKGDIPGISETGKKLVQKRGVMRLISIVGFQAFKYGLISLLGIPLIPGDDDDEDGLSEKIRTLLPFWDTNSDISVREVKPNGNFTYVSISASDPYGSIFKVVNATKNSAKTGEGFSEIFGELSGPFVSEDILLNTLRNISSNENDYGGKIWRNTDPPFEKSEKIALQLYKTFEPGGITSTRKIIQSENKLNEALGQFTGFKLHEVKSLEQAGFKFGDIQKKAQESKSAYNSIKYNMDDYETQEDINKVIRASKKAMDEDYQEAVKLYQALISLGVSDRDIKKKMYDYGISGPMRSQIARNSVDVKLNPIKK